MKNGYCKTHGNVQLWVVCKHVFNDTAKNMVISQDGEALCFECLGRVKSLVMDDLITICDSCLRTSVKRLIKKVDKDKDIRNLVIGLENLYIT